MSLPGFDFNELFSDPLKNLGAARFAINRTEIGRSGLVKIELDNENKIVYVNASTGLRSKNYSDVFLDASADLVTKYNIVRGKSEGSFNPKLEQVSDYLESLNRKLVSQLGENDVQEKLKKIGLTEQEVNELTTGRRKLSIELSQLKNQKTPSGEVTVQDVVKRNLDNLGKENYFPFIDDKSANVIRFRSYLADGSGESKLLTGMQVHYILAVMQQPLSSMSKLDSIFRPGSEADIQDYFAKQPKRFKGLFSERDLTIGVDDVFESMIKDKNNFLAGLSEEEIIIKKNKLFDDSILIVDEGLDFLRQYVGTDIDEVGFTQRSKDAQIAIRESSDARRSLISSLTRSVSTEDLAKGSGIVPLVGDKAAEDFIEKYFGFGPRVGQFSSLLSDTAEDGTLGSQTSKKLLTAIEESLGKDSPDFQLMKRMFSDAEKELDGDFAINQRLYQSKLSSLKNRIKQQEILAAADPSNEILKEDLMQLKNQYKLVESSDTYQLTVRGAIRFRSAKSRSPGKKILWTSKKIFNGNGCKWTKERTNRNRGRCKWI